MELYGIVNLLTYKFIYIGITSKGTFTRFKRHLRDKLIKNKNLKLCQTINKYGRQNFVPVPLIVEVKSWKELQELEIASIQIFKTHCREGGCNMTSGGEGLSDPPDETRIKIGNSRRGCKHSEEAKNKIKIARQKQVSPMKDKHHSKETKLKLSNFNKGKVLSPETKLKLSKINKSKIFSKETRVKLSKSQKGNKKALGHKQSEEHILKRMEAIRLNRLMKK